jgi:hypothetical protein
MKKPPAADTKASGGFVFSYWSNDQQPARQARGLNGC